MAIFRWIWQKICIPFSKFMADIASPIAIACATVAILYVSSGQWKEMQKALKATNNLVEATNLQANAIVASQSPIVFVPLIRLFNIPTEKGQTVGAEITQGTPPENSILRVVIINGGKGNARIIALDVESQVIQTLPETPIYKELRGANILLTENVPLVLDLDDRKISIIPSEQDEIRIKRKSLWVYGYLSYRDAFEAITDVGFIYEWKAGDQPANLALKTSFMGFGPAGYVYEHKHPKPKAKE